MSKSEGNFLTIRELLDVWPGDVLRFQMLQTHYRQPIDWTDTRCRLAKSELEDWAFVLQNYYKMEAANEQPPTAFVASLLDDLNTPAAISELRRLHTTAKHGDIESKLEFARACKFMGFQRLGEPGLFETGVSFRNAFDQSFDYFEEADRIRAATANNAPDMVLTKLISQVESDTLKVKIDASGSITLVGNDTDQTVEIQSLVDARLIALKNNDFADADRIRDELTAQGIQLEDSKDAETGERLTSWERKR